MPEATDLRDPQGVDICYRHALQSQAVRSPGGFLQRSRCWFLRSQPRVSPHFPKRWAREALMPSRMAGRLRGPDGRQSPPISAFANTHRIGIPQHSRRRAGRFRAGSGGRMAARRQAARAPLRVRGRSRTGVQRPVTAAKASFLGTDRGKAGGSLRWLCASAGPAEGDARRRRPTGCSSTVGSEGRNEREGLPDREMIPAAGSFRPPGSLPHPHSDIPTRGAPLPINSPSRRRRTSVERLLSLCAGRHCRRRTPEIGAVQGGVREGRRLLASCRARVARRKTRPGMQRGRIEFAAGIILVPLSANDLRCHCGEEMAATFFLGPRPCVAACAAFPPAPQTREQLTATITLADSVEGGRRRA